MENAEPGHGNEIERLLEKARLQLVDTGTRNRLVHVNRANQRANALNIVDGCVDEAFELLRAKGWRIRFRATGSDEDEEADDLHIAVAEEDASRAGGRRHGWLDTPLGPDALQRRLLRLFRDARTAEEEQGVNILYLALGFLTWFEDGRSEVRREAPLILLPVELARSARGFAFELRVRDDDLATNLPLQERLKADLGIVLPELEEDEDWHPSAYLDAVEDAVSGQTRWSVDRDGMQIGLFSFAKLLMMRDLEPAAWPQDVLDSDTLVGKILTAGFEMEPSLFLDEQRLDERFDPADLVQIVDADASQTKVIEEARAGRNLVVQGPPGTGKSQTIANIIAAAVHDGKSVLFMAEKMAALKVVHARLVEANLPNICLELHSKNANKKAVLQELDRTLHAGSNGAAALEGTGDLRQTRNLLNRIAGLLHEPLEGADYSPFSAMAEIGLHIGRNSPPPVTAPDGLTLLTGAERDRLCASIQDYVNLLSQAGARKDHPLTGVRALDLQPPALQRLEDVLGAAIHLAQDALDTGCEAAAGLPGAPPTTSEDLEALAHRLQKAPDAPHDMERLAPILLAGLADGRLTEGLEVGRAWREARDGAGGKFSEAAWSAPVAVLRASLAKGAASFWARWFGDYRRASRELATLLQDELPANPAARLAAVDTLMEIQRRHHLLADDEPMLAARLGEYWRGERTDFAKLVEGCSWLAALTWREEFVAPELAVAFAGLGIDATARLERLRPTLERLPNTVELVVQKLSLEAGDWRRLTLSELKSWLERIRVNLNRYDEWSDLETYRNTLIESDLQALVAAIDDGRLPPEQAEADFRYAVAEARWDAARAALPALDKVRRLDRHRLVADFVRMDRHRFGQVQALIRDRHLGSLPTGTAGEMAFIRGEIAKKTRHRPIRTLMTQAGGMVKRIKPVFLMSPLSIAQFLPPGKIDFDILVIDEASQVRPEDALGAIARARQLVVVGDQKRLPPTSFFSRKTSGDDDDEEAPPTVAGATEMESILTLCEARGLNSGMLEWHYRSRDPSLIQVSNVEFYDDRLVLPPSPINGEDGFGLKLTRVPGVYSSKGSGRGRPNTNRIEAECIANALADHARTQPNLSVGVVAFSKAQSDMITEVLELRRRTNFDLDALLRKGVGEDVFVKNIENVQGDERDVILISVGYGPNEPNGRLASMNFGPINNEGGERRLNVLFTRARHHCRVFASFDPSDIDPTRSKAVGPRVLKRFLEFAGTGALDAESTVGGAAESPFEEDVAEAIAGLGYPVDHQVGSVGFRIDLGVRHPQQTGRYILAVECDGATWHSALWARERDRLRQQTLEGLGWRFHRIWSTDWFHRRRQEIDRLREALEEAQNAPKDERPERKIVPPPTPPTLRPVKPPEPTPQAGAMPYVVAKLSWKDGGEPEDAPVEKLETLVTKIVEIEGPVHLEEAARRVAAAFGKSKAGTRIRMATDRALRQAGRRKALLAEGKFWMTEKQRLKPPVRDRSAAPVATRNPEYLPTAEIKAAAADVERQNGRMTHKELVREIARLLGFQRTGSDLRAQIAAALVKRASCGQTTRGG